jgi:hypothetical protein
MGEGILCENCGGCDMEAVEWLSGPYKGRTFYVCPVCGCSDWMQVI